MKIVVGEDQKILRTKLKPVVAFDEKLKKLVDDMEKTMMEPEDSTGVQGVGLAANQVGVNLRVMLVAFNVSTKKDWKVTAMINPEILESSENKVQMEEGCLSLPGVYANVSRPAKIKVRWQNIKGNWCEKKLDKWDARIFLHEYDHLEGKFFTDYLSKKQKQKAFETAKK